MSEEKLTVTIEGGNLQELAKNLAEELELVDDSIAMEKAIAEDDGYRITWEEFKAKHGLQEADPTAEQVKTSQVETHWAELTGIWAPERREQFDWDAPLHGAPVLLHHPVTGTSIFSLLRYAPYQANGELYEKGNALYDVRGIKGGAYKAYDDAMRSAFYGQHGWRIYVKSTMGEPLTAEKLPLGTFFAGELMPDEYGQDAHEVYPLCFLSRMPESKTPHVTILKDNFATAGLELFPQNILVTEIYQPGTSDSAQLTEDGGWAFGA